MDRQTGLHLGLLIALCFMPVPGFAADQPAASGAAHTAHQWEPLELAFTAQHDHDRPLDPESARLAATFTGPTGEKLALVGFWDGGRTWKVRFAPTRPGKWRYETTFSNAGDAGLHARRGTVDVAPPRGDNPLFRHGGFLKVSPNGRHLTYSDGTPFFWLGDTWWFCPSRLVPIDGSSKPDCPSMFRKLIDTRARQRFTVVQMCFLGPPQIAAGLEGFSVLKPDEWKPRHVAYWQQVDRYIRYANSRGIVPVVGMTFHSGAEAVSLDSFRRLWSYFFARYGAMPVGVLIQGEYNLKRGPVEQRVEKVLELGRFIKEIDPYKRAMTVHPWYYRNDEHQAWDKPWYDFIMVQGGHGREGPPPEYYLKVYRRQRPKPLLEAECTYEGIRGHHAAVVRHNAYKAIQSGSFGYTYGSHGLWYPNQSAEDQKFDNWGKPVPWWEAIERPGGNHMRHLRTCYESVAWWKLEPKPGAVMPGGKVLARADGDRVFLLYLPNDGDTAAARLVGPKAGTAYTGEWFNPRTGQKTTVAGKLLAASDGLPLPKRPDSQDWVLILEKRP